MNKSQLPIGMFDSGVGGTSILREVNSLMPNEQIIYLADSKHAPYGNKLPDKIIELSFKNTHYLLEKGVKLIIVACNTATTNAIDKLRSTFPEIPFIGIEPAIKPAALSSVNKRIGVLATKGTLSSELFAKTSKKYIEEAIEIIEKEGVGLVEAVESNNLNDPQFISHFHKQLDYFVDAKVDSIVLGCTHYPYLIPLMKSYLPASIDVIDSGEAVARQTKRILKENLLLQENMLTTKPNIELYTNRDTITLNALFDHEIRRGLVKVTYLDF
jgi:glutamate racemase